MVDSQPDVPGPDVIELHLKADKNLDKQAALALARMFRVAYAYAAEAQSALQSAEDQKRSDV